MFQVGLKSSGFASVIIQAFDRKSEFPWLQLYSLKKFCIPKFSQESTCTLMYPYKNSSGNTPLYEICEMWHASMKLEMVIIV